jgi:ABC-type spermidine/putrescine transport system permease subunit II
VTGVILAVLIGVLVAYGYTRLRGKLKLNVRSKDWVAPIIIVAIVVLLLWANATTHGGH